MNYFKTFPSCGAKLDPGEVCDYWETKKPPPVLRTPTRAGWNTLTTLFPLLMISKIEEEIKMNERAKTIGLIADMLCKIADEKLLDRIYRFTKYIYLHRD